MRPLVVVVILMLGLAACGGGAAPMKTAAVTSHTLRGAMTIEDAHGYTSSDGDTTCEGSNGYNDLSAGASVTVTNQSQTVIGSSQLGTGSVVGSGNANGANWCEFRFTVTGVPLAKFYGLEVSHRGTVTFSAAQMAQVDWRPALSIGGS